jgi:hypothetical protein
MVCSSSSSEEWMPPPLRLVLIFLATVSGGR